MSDLTRQLEAGGLVPTDAPVPADLPVDTVDARGYRHPALKDRVVVRLVSDAIAEGVDTEMALLDFVLADHADDIAKMRRRAMGFPGQALVNDPERARYALDVMKEFKAQAKRIQSKPGHARDGFDQIAKALSRTVPQFLPSFWEEVGRAFANAGNVSYAAQSFDKARASEREFGLRVDEEVRGEAFLEFALLGALTVKSLQSYGKELQTSVGADAAYERMFSLASRRTLGGLPPWASLPKDLRALAKGAKRDLAAEDARLLRELLGSSSMVRAPASFWAEYRDALVALAGDDPAIRARLLDLFPNGGKTRWAWRQDDDGFQDSWMELLVDSGALAALWDADTPAAALPPGGRARWLSRLQEWSAKGDGWVLQVVRKAAPVLRADGVKIPVRGGDWYKPLDLDLVELLLEEQVPWALVEGHVQVKLDEWAAGAPADARSGLPAEIRPRDPVRAAQEPAVATLLGPAVDAAFGDAAFEAVAAGMVGLSELRRAWLAERVSDLDAGGLAATAIALSRLESATSPATFAEFPESLEALGATDVAKALHRTLVEGVFDEFHWPAFDHAMAVLKPKDDEEIHLGRQWPHLIVADARKLLVLGPNGVEHEHDVKLGKDQRPTLTAWVGGQAWVAWSGWTGGSYKTQAYWSGAPNDPFEVERAWAAHGSSNPWPQGSALILGTGRVAVGDRTSLPAPNRQFHDHERSWALADDGKMRVQDRTTGKLGDEGCPSFLADVIGQPADDYALRVVPAAWAATSPLGVVDGLYGAKRIRPKGSEDLDLDADLDDDAPRPDAEVTLRTLAGETFAGTIRHGTGLYYPAAMVRWPGAARPRPAAEVHQYWRQAHDTKAMVAEADRPVVSLVQIDGLRMAHARLPPLDWWHALVPRDPAGSAALRKLRPDAARTLLDGATTEAGGTAGALDAALSRVLPEVTDPTLKAGLMAITKLAADYEGRLGKLRAGRVGGKVGQKAAVEVTDAAAGPALSNLRSTYWWGNGHTSAEISTLGRFLVGGENDLPVLFSNLQPREWLGRIRGIAMSATRPGLSDAERETLHRLLAGWRDAGLGDDGWFRLGTLKVERLEPWIPVTEEDGVKAPADAWRYWEDDRRILVFDCEGDEAGPWEGAFVEWSRTGRFAPYPGCVTSRTREIHVQGDRAWLDGFLAAAKGQGARPVTPEAVAALSEAAGLSAAEAAVALAAFPTELDKETRTALGLKAADCKGVAAAFTSWERDRKLTLLAAAAPDEPTRAWDADPADPGSATARFVAGWLATQGRTVPVPGDLLAAAEKELMGWRAGGARLRKLASAEGWTELSNDARWVVGAGGNIVVEGTTSDVDDEYDEDDDAEKGAFDGALAHQLAELLPWVWIRLPVGDPLRAQVVPVWEKAVQRAANPDLWLHGGTWYIGEPRQKKAGDAWFDALGGELTTITDPDEGEVVSQQRRAGPLVATRDPYRLHLAFRPSALDPHSRSILDTWCKLVERPSAQLEALERLRSEDFAALIRRTVDTPVPAGAWEQDPSKSAPAVVDAVAAHHGLTREAAALYLQTLTLLDPTKKSVITWNDWSPRTYTAAAAELVGKGLVIEGKRARAGREHFLPGGWVEEKQILPYEEWKRPLYGWTGDSYPFAHPIPLAPLHLLFERAWARCVAKDAPRFEEVRR